MFFLQGCLNNKAGNSSDASSPTSVPMSSLQGPSLPSGTTLYNINLLQVLASTVDPAGTLDLIGQNSEIGGFCPTVSDCFCRISWIENGATLQSNLPPSYVENNLMRCAYTMTRNVSQFTISISIQTGSAGSSNALVVNSPYQNPNTNTSNIQNYKKVIRYQCRDIPQVNSDFYLGTLLDPQVWNLSYTFNLSSTSLGSDYGYTSPGYECPQVPTPFLSPPYISTDNIYDMRVFSVGAVNGDSTIYPANDAANEAVQFNRHDYFLARFQDGSFRQPVCTAHTIRNGNNNLSGQALDCAVDNSTSPAAVGADVIGFAAVPDTNGSCPSNITLPAKKKWAKLWQFRASLSMRNIINVANVPDIGTLSCTTTDAEFTGTATTVNGYRYATATTPIYNFGAVSATRFDNAEFGNCRGASCAFTNGSARYNMRAGYGNTTGPTCSSTSRNAFCASPGGEFDAIYPAASSSGAPGLRHAGTDNGGSGSSYSSQNVDGFVNPPANAGRGRGGSICNPTLPGDRWSYGAGSGGRDTWLISSYGTCIEADTNSNGLLYNDDSGAFLNSLASANNHPIKNWFDFIGVRCPASGDCSTQPSGIIQAASNSPVTPWGGYGIYRFTTRQIDSASSADFLYVVTPTTVSKSQMENPNDPTFQQYQPYRYINGRAVYYGLDSGSLNTSDPAQRLPVFPLCVIQEAP